MVVIVKSKLIRVPVTFISHCMSLFPNTKDINVNVILGRASAPLVYAQDLDVGLLVPHFASKASIMPEMVRRTLLARRNTL